MEFDSSRPIWQQLLDEMRLLVADGRWPAGSRIPTVRDLAASYQVNPNTVQRALAEFERQAFCHTERTAGRFVTDSVDQIATLRHELITEAAVTFITEVKRLKINETESIELLKNTWNEVPDEH